MLPYRFIKTRGSLHETTAPEPLAVDLRRIPKQVLQLVPEAVARQNMVLPLTLEGETLTVAAVRADDLGLRDKLSFIVNKKIQLVPVQREALLAAINRHYPPAKAESVDSLLHQLKDAPISSGLAARPTSIDLDSPNAAFELAHRPERGTKTKLARQD
jgi:hypothetical protein